MNRNGLATIAGLALLSMGTGAATFEISTFEDAEADLAKWSPSSVTLSVAPREPTDLNNMLKVVFEDAAYPGISTRPPPEWTPYEALRFVVWTPTAFTLHVRIDDPNTTDYHTRYNRTFRLEPGRNLCQIEVSDIDRQLDLRRIRNLVMFVSRPPAGLTVHFDEIVLGPLLTEQVPFIPYDERNDLQPTLDVMTPHIPFGRNFADGPVRAFFLTGIAYGREVPEMMQRMDLDVSLMTWDRNWDVNTWGMGDFYARRGQRFDYVLMQRYLASSMQGPETFETLVLSTPQGWDRFPPGAREALRKRVYEDGEGLVLVFPFPGGMQGAEWPADLRELSALVDSDTDYPDPPSGYIRPGGGIVRGRAWRIVNEHPIVRDLPLAAIPTENISIQRYRTSPGATVLIETDDGAPVLAVKPFGRGQVATFAWRSRAITPDIDNTAALAETRPYRYWEPVYSLLNRAVAWTAGRPLSREGQPARLETAPEHADGALGARVWKDAEERVTDWELTFTPPAESPIAALDLSAPWQVLRGEPIDVAFTARNGDDLTAQDSRYHVRVELLERVGEQWRTLERGDRNLLASRPGEPGGYAVRFPSERVRQIMAVARVTILEGERTVAAGEAEIVVTPVYQPGQRRWEDYEILMWPVGGLPFLSGVEDRLMQTFGSTGVMTTRWHNEAERMRWARAGLRFMPHEIVHGNLHRRNWGEVVANWNRTRDRRWLVREPSYADPEFLERERNAFTRAVNTILPFDPTNYVLADEPSITSYALDFDYDFHPANIEGLRRELRRRFGTIEALNDALGTDFARFEAVEPPLTDEARAAGNWGLWNEWRRHNDFVMAEGYRMYRDALLAVDPKGTISVSGTQTATAFAGFDWGRLSPLFGTMQGYGYGYQDNKRMSFNPDMINASPAGYGRAGPAVDHQLWSKLADHGGGHVLFWWVAFRNPDLTFSRSALDYRERFAEMRRGIGRQYLQARRRMSPVAILYSMNSLRAAYTEGRMSGRSGEFPSNESRVTGALVAAGFDPLFVTEEQVADGILAERGIRALFLPMTLSLGYGDKPGGLAVRPAIEAFVEDGGLLSGTHPFRYDEFIQTRTPPQTLVERMVAFDDIREDLAGALAPAGAAPWATLRDGDGGAIHGANFVVHRLQGEADAHLVTVLRRPIGTRQVLGDDGVIHEVPEDRGGREVEPATLDTSAFGAVTVYAPREARILSPNGGTVVLNLRAGDGVPLALLPYTVERLETTARREGRTLVVEWRLHADTPRFTAHVVHVETTDPAGVPLEALSANALTRSDGTGRIAFPLAREEESMDLSVSVRDVLTGTTVQTGP